MLDPVLRTQLFKLADKIKTDIYRKSTGHLDHVDEKELAAFSQLIQASFNLTVPPFKVVDCRWSETLRLETLNPLTMGIEAEPDSWPVAQAPTSVDLTGDKPENSFPLKHWGKRLIIERIDHWLDLIEQSELSAMTPIQAVAPDEAEPHLTTDEKLIELFDRNPSAKKWTQRELAEAIDRSKTSVAESPIYKYFRAEINQCKPLSDAKLFRPDI